MVRQLSLLLAASVFAACASSRSAFRREDPLKSARESFEAREYRKALDLLPDEGFVKLPRRVRAEAYHLKGLSYERAGQGEKALQIYQLAVGLYPKDLKLLTNLGNILNRVGLPERARPHFEEVLRIHPNNAGAHLGLGDIFRRLGFLQKAIFHYEKTLEHWPDNPDIWRRYAEALSDAGQYGAAVNAAKKSLSFRRDTQGLAVLARNERLGGDAQEGYAQFDDALALTPEDASLLLEKSLWLLEDGRLSDAKGLAENVIARTPEQPLAHWITGAISARNGDLKTARDSFKISAAAAVTHPFIASAARAMLKELSAAKQP